jgi:hypothetical protein
MAYGQERLIRLMNVEKIVRICHPGVPASAGRMPVGTAVYGRERLIRLMNVEKIARVCHPGVPASAGRMPAGTATYCRERLIRLKPGLLSGDIWNLPAIWYQRQ